VSSIGHRISHLEGQIGVDGRGAHQPLNRNSTIDNSWISDKSLPTYDNVMGSFDTNYASMETSPDKRGNPWVRAGANSSAADESFGPSVDGSLIMNKSDFLDKSASVDAGPFAGARGKQEELDDDFEGEYDDEEEIIDHEAKIQEVYEKYKGKDPALEEADQENTISFNQSMDAEPDPNRTPAKTRF